MGNLSNYTETKLMNHVFKIASYTPPTNIYVSLHTANPGEDGTGAEVSGNGYARKVCNVWNAASSKGSANTNAITFDQSTGPWGTVTYYALWDALTGGNMLAYGSLSTNKVIVIGNVLSIAAGGITLTASSTLFSTYLGNKILDHLLKTASYTVPTNIYVAVSTTDPTEAGTGIAEPSSSYNYARTLCNGWEAGDSTTGKTQNTAAITTPVASGDWGTIAYTATFDALTGGNMLTYGTLTPSQAVGANDSMEWAAGSFVMTLD